MSTIKTAEEIFRDTVKMAEHDSSFDMAIEAMRTHTRQALEAYRDEVMDGLEYEDTNRIRQINIDDYLK